MRFTEKDNVHHLRVLRPQRKVAIQTIPLACLMDDMRQYNARAIDLLADVSARIQTEEEYSDKCGGTKRST